MSPAFSPWTSWKKTAIINQYDHFYLLEYPANGLLREERNRSLQMKDLLFFLVLAAIGYFIGSRCRNARKLTRWTGHFQTIAIIVLIFTMGLRMGANEEVIGNLASIGLISAALTVAVMLASAGSAYIIRKCIGMDHFARMKKIEQSKRDLRTTSEQSETADMEQSSSSQRLTAILILISVLSGLLGGYFYDLHATPQAVSSMDGFAAIIVNGGLAILLFMTGVNIGIEGAVAESFKKVGLKILLFPLGAMAGAMICAALFALILQLDLRETLAECAGFGWYTIASAIILDRGMISCAAIAFMHSIMREYFTLLSVPFLAKKIGYMETIAIAGGTAMGVCMPVIAKCTRGDVAVYSFISGLIHAASVPVLIPLLLG